MIWGYLLAAFFAGTTAVASFQLWRLRRSNLLAEASLQATTDRRMTGRRMTDSSSSIPQSREMNPTETNSRGTVAPEPNQPESIAPESNSPETIAPEIQQLVGEFSHDINNALVAIGLNTERLGSMHSDKSSQDLVKEIQEAIHQIHSHNRTMQRLDCRPTNKLHLHTIGELFDSIISHCSNKLETTFPVTYACDRDRTIMANQELLSSAALALIQNGLESGTQTGLDIEITDVPASIETTDGSIREYVQFRVKDNGRGMSESIRPVVCLPYSSDKKNHRGMGLTIAWGAASAHGGELIINSQVNQGTEVSLRIPLQQPEPQLR